MTEVFIEIKSISLSIIHISMMHISSNHMEHAKRKRTINKWNQW